MVFSRKGFPKKHKKLREYINFQLLSGTYFPSFHHMSHLEYIINEIIAKFDTKQMAT